MSKLKAVSWAASVAAFFLIPKCPACLAAWLFMLTGVGVSLSVVAGMKTAVILLGIAAFIWQMTVIGRRVFSARSHCLLRPELQSTSNYKPKN